MPRPRRALPSANEVIRIFIFVDVDNGVSAEIYGIRTGCKTPVIHIGIEYLCGQGFPSASRTAISKSRPALPEAAELFFKIGYQLRIDGVPIGAQIGRIHRI